VLDRDDLGAWTAVSERDFSIGSRVFTGSVLKTGGDSSSRGMRVGVERPSREVGFSDSMGDDTSGGDANSGGEYSFSEEVISSCADALIPCLE